MSTLPERATVVVSGGAGYIGSHTVYALKQAGYKPVVIDSLVKGNLWATGHAAAFRQGDIGDASFVRGICDEFRPVAALHFAAFIEVGESVEKPEMYFHNNFEKAKTFFDVLAEKRVQYAVFSSTAAVYGEAAAGPIREDMSAAPINPYGESKWQAELAMREIPGLTTVALRYFNVAGAAPEAGLGEAHFPESHVIPRLVLPLIGLPDIVLEALRLRGGFKLYGTDYPTPDGTAIRDYIHVCDLAEAHVLALEYLLDGGATNIINLGSGSGYSVLEIVNAARKVLGVPDYQPGVAGRRAGDPAMLVADSSKARSVLGWTPQRGIEEMIGSAAAWHRTAIYQDTILGKAKIALT
jgi:UDP-glucose-4-epimerase GalE